jgi:ATP-dependent DNA helicase RecG
MSEAEFWSLLGRVEHERLEFKRGAPDQLAETIAAMSMTDGGLVVLGVNDDRTLKGAPLSQRTLDRVTSNARECHVEVQLREVLVDGAAITVVAVPEVRGRIVTTPDGRLLRRVGGSSQPLVGDVMARFVREREERSAEEVAIPVIDPADFDIKSVNTALRKEGRPTVRRDGLTRALVDLGVAEVGSPPTGTIVTTAAAVLFAVEPTKIVPGASVQVIRREGIGPGPGPTRAREEFTGPLYRVVEDVLDFIRDNTRRFQAVVGTHREIVSEYPEAVLREAVLNALAHRDYGLRGSTVDITIWDDRIEVHSPGPLPGHITVENIRDEHYSRNRRIMQTLRVLGLVEEYGEGVDRMFGEMEARLMEPPLFTATASSVTVTIRNRFLVAVEDQVWLALLGHYELSPQERRVLVAAQREGFVTRRRVRELLPDADPESVLAGAVAKGLFVRVGERGGARYVLADEVVMRAGASGIEARSRKRQMLLDEVRRRGSLSTAEGAELLDEDVTLVRHMLNDLTRAGLVRAEGRTRARRYYAT